MDDTQFDLFEHLVTSHTGIRLRARQRALLQTVLQPGLVTLGLASFDDYYRMLQSASSESRSEWNRILHELTNNESYFFRDKGQFALLRDRILPEIISRNSETQTLRIWSAGCSTGEEAYSLAALIEELLVALTNDRGRQWDVLVLGTDIDEHALVQARRGIYGSWSFRMVEPSIRNRYFRESEQGWGVSDAVRSHVKFVLSNLVADDFPSVATGIENIDLILCRNVFIYFDPTAVSLVLQKFADTLKLSGYLMTGHVEILGNKVAPLKTLSFPESEVYQKVSTASQGDPQLDLVAFQTPRKENKQFIVGGDEEKEFLSNYHTEAVHDSHSSNTASGPLSRHETEPSGSESLEIVNHSRSLADKGHYELAVEGCHRAIKTSPFAPEPYELLAAIAIELGQFEEAKVWLKNALYLAPASAQIYLELGHIYRSEGEKQRADRMYRSALELLKDLAPETVVGAPGSPTAAEFMRHLSEISEEAA